MNLPSHIPWVLYFQIIGVLMILGAMVAGGRK